MYLTKASTEGNDRERGVESDLFSWNEDDARPIFSTRTCGSNTTGVINSAINALVIDTSVSIFKNHSRGTSTEVLCVEDSSHCVLNIVKYDSCLTIQ